MITNGWELPTPPNKILIGNTEDIYKTPDGVPFTVSQKCDWDYKKYPHALLIGGTGTGKTTVLKKITATFAQQVKDSEIYLCTFKHRNDDFPYLAENLHFASYSRCTELFESLHTRLTARLNGEDSTQNLLMMVFDEWAGFLLSLDKKEQEDKLKKLGQILMLGRSMNIQALIAMQRPDALFFKNGARDNFNLILAMGNLSADGKHMIFSSDFIDQLKPCIQIGEGYALIAGSVLNRIRVPPPTTDIDKILKYKLS